MGESEGDTWSKSARQRLARQTEMEYTGKQDTQSRKNRGKEMDF